MMTYSRATDLVPIYTSGWGPASPDCTYCAEGQEIETDHVHLTYCQRAGASNRTADELVAVFLFDVEDCTTWRMPADVRTIAESCDGWLDDPDDAETLRDAMSSADDALSDCGLWAEWDDGYVIGEVIAEVRA